MICSVEKILENKKIENGIYKISIKGNYDAIPGQFYMLRPMGDNILLPRPISVYDVEHGCISFLYAAIGKGTKIISQLKPEDEIQIMGPLGNGFDLNLLKGKIAMVSGGIGIAPLVYLSKQLHNCEIDFYAGFRDVDYSVDNVDKYVNNIYLSTENGSKGHKGYIVELFQPEKYDMVITCGPKIMMKKVADMCKDKGVQVYVSMENRMACGIGACLGCTCKTVYGNKTTCKTGPVFLGEDLIWDE